MIWVKSFSSFGSKAITHVTLSLTIKHIINYEIKSSTHDYNDYDKNYDTVQKPVS